MKRLFIFWVILLPALTQHVHAQYYSVNYDARTVAAMAAAFGTEAVAESYYREQVDDILKHYTAAEVAAAGIFSSKFWNTRLCPTLVSGAAARKITTIVEFTTWWQKNHAENMGGGEADAALTTNSNPLGQLPDESVRRYEEPVYAVRKCGDKQHAVVLGHRFSGN